MRATVLNDPALAKHAGRFAWLSINTEDSHNAAFVEHLGVEAYPTFLVLDGANGNVALRWAGSLTKPEFERLLDDGERAVKGSGGARTGAASGKSAADAALARADRLGADKKMDEAAAAYTETLQNAPAAWAGRGRAVNSLLAALQKTGKLEDCAAVARREAPALERGPAFAAAGATGLGCALEAPESAAWRAGALKDLEPLVVESLALDNVLADDRSSAYGTLVDLRDSRGDEAGRKEMAGRWLTFLESQAAAAKSVEARAAFDSHRVAAALALGDPGRAVPALLASEKDLPDDYNPPARLAILYRELGRFDEALTESQRALDLAYGARKLRIFDARADIYAKKGDKAAAKRTLEDALAYADTLPKSQQPQGLIASLRKKAAAIPS
ncbi:MAG TPA: thioredoxin family protein, partial [Candidatus Polarisedimenticolia bacterium]|nr:thioredoxin family protein [Candidatus Polarisedimenticolia bacterium]